MISGIIIAAIASYFGYLAMDATGSILWAAVTFFVSSIVLLAIWEYTPNDRFDGYF